MLIFITLEICFSKKNNKVKKSIKKITDEIVSKTKVYENVKVNGGKNPARANTVEDILKNSVQFFKEYNKTNNSIDINEFAKKGKKLVRAKSLLGLAVVLPLAASMQFINRWITEKTSGVKGAPIYNDFGKDDANKIDDSKKKEGLLKQKIISMSSMLTVGLLSMMKLPNISMLEFKGIFPSMDQARLISTTTFMSRMAAADDKNELAELEAQEKEITPDLNQEIVYKFQRIIQRNNEGIVKVRNGVCTGCQMILPGQFANEVRDGEKILFCPYCSRILTYEEVKEDEVEDFSTLDETGSLADFDDAFADETEEDDIDDGDNDAGIDDDKSMVFDD